MTFIKSHAEALHDFVPLYAGSHRVKGLELPVHDVFVVNTGTPVGALKEFAFRQFGWAPHFIARLKRRRPSIVHTHFGTAGPAGMTVARHLSIPHVVTFHGKDATMPVTEANRSRRGRELLKRKQELIEHTGTFIAVSEFIRTRLIEQGYPEDKIVVHRNGINLEFFNLPEGGFRKPVILFVGRFVEKKGVVHLIEAASLMKHKGVRFELVLIGDGPLQQELEAKALESGVLCRFEGFLPAKEVREWLGRAAVVAVPSVTASNGDTEGLPTILLEAQAMGAPIVATRHSGIPEGVIEGVTADLVDEGDVRGLAAHLTTFVESPEKVREYGAAGRKFVTERFDIREQARGLEKIYASLIESRARS